MPFSGEHEADVERALSPVSLVLRSTSSSYRNKARGYSTVLSNLTLVTVNIAHTFCPVGQSIFALLSKPPHNGHSKDSKLELNQLLLEVRLKSERRIYFDLLYLQEVKESIDAFEASLRAVIPPASPIGFEG